MIIERLIIENFRTFVGRQKLVLETARPGCPAVVVTGVEGAGKSSLLEALAVGLYGKRARSPSRRSRPYHAYLRDCIHRHANPFEGAAVELGIRLSTGSRPQQLVVRRSWTAMGERVYEDLEVSVDGAYSADLSEHWDDHIEQLLPRSISTLILYDAHTERQHARNGESVAHLEEALDYLLGLDLVDQLVDDLDILQDKKLAALSASSSQLSQVRRALAEAVEQSHQIRRALESARRRLSRRREYMSILDEQLRQGDLALYEHRQCLESRHATIRRQLTGQRNKLRRWMAGVAPFMLVEPLLDTVLEQADRERLAAVSRTMLDRLRQRDAQILGVVQERVADDTVRTQIEDLLASSRAEVEDGADTHAYLHLSEPAHRELSSMHAEGLREASRRQDEHLQAIDNLRAQLHQCELDLADVPHSHRLAGIVERRERARRRLDVCRRRVRDLEDERDRLQRRIDELDRRLRQFVDEEVADDHAANEISAALALSPRLLTGLSRFRTLLIEQHLARIERLIHDSLEDLTGAQSPIEEVHIDPSTLHTTLLDASGASVDEKTLSNGQCQLVAVAIRWGLARAFGHSLPLVVDNPLIDVGEGCASLLIDNYLRTASDQVILLIDPEAVSARQRASLAPLVSHHYRLETDDSSNSTAIRRTPFFEIDGEAAR
jgi:DNA sulfur modification protein DndD